MSFHIVAQSILLILFHQMTEFMITWTLLWNKRSHVNKVFKFLIHDLRHSPVKPRLKFSGTGIPVDSWNPDSGRSLWPIPLLPYLVVGRCLSPEVGFVFWKASVGGLEEDLDVAIVG